MDDKILRAIRLYEDEEPNTQELEKLELVEKFLEEDKEDDKKGK